MGESEKSGLPIQNLRKYGSPPYSVAVIHGGPGAAGEMAPVAEELSSTCGILEPLQTAPSIDGQISELHSVLEEVASLPVTMIGHSWGAWLSLILATRYASFVRKLVMVGSGPLEQSFVPRIMETRLSRLNDEERAEAYALLRILDHGGTTDRSMAGSRLAELISRTDDYDPLPRSPQVDTPGLDLDIYEHVWKEAVQLREHGELLNMAAHIQCPVVVIHGEHDPHPYEGVERPLSRIPVNFRFLLLGKCGHSPWMERAARQEFYRILKSELNP